MSEVMKIIDERDTKRKQKQKQKGTRGMEAIVKAKWFCCVFKLDFLQLICKASLIFKSYLELILSIILRERELSELKHVAEECICLEIWDLLSFLICSSFQVLKWRQISPI